MMKLAEWKAQWPGAQELVSLLAVRQTPKKTWRFATDTKFCELKPLCFIAFLAQKFYLFSSKMKLLICPEYTERSH